MNRTIILTVTNIVCLMGYVVFIQWSDNKRLTHLTTIQESELRIQSNQLLDLSQQSNNRALLEYQRGFEEGKAHMGVAFLHEGTMEDYADGYHAAVDQFGPDVSSEDEQAYHETLEEMFFDAVALGDTELAGMVKELLITELEGILEHKEEEILYTKEQDLKRILQAEADEHDKEAY